jgi:hypothetical protein
MSRDECINGSYRIMSCNWLPGVGEHVKEHDYYATYNIAEAYTTAPGFC